MLHIILEIQYRNFLLLFQRQFMVEDSLRTNLPKVQKTVIQVKAPALKSPKIQRIRKTQILKIKVKTFWNGTQNQASHQPRTNN